MCRDISSQNVLEEVAHSYCLHQLWCIKSLTNLKTWTLLQKLLTMQRWARKAAKQVEPSTALNQKKQAKALLGQSLRRYWPWPNPTPPNVYTKKPITLSCLFHLPYTVSPPYSCSCSLQRLPFHLRILTFAHESNRTQVKRRDLLIH